MRPTLIRRILRVVEETGAATTVYAFCKAAESHEALLETA